MRIILHSQLFDIVVTDNHKMWNDRCAPSQWEDEVHRKATLHPEERGRDHTLGIRGVDLSPTSTGGKTDAIMGTICVDTAVSKWAGEDDWMNYQPTKPGEDSQPTRTNHHRHDEGSKVERGGPEKDEMEDPRKSKFASFYLFLIFTRRKLELRQSWAWRRDIETDQFSACKA